MIGSLKVSGLVFGIACAWYYGARVKDTKMNSTKNLKKLFIVICLIKILYC